MKTSTSLVLLSSLSIACGSAGTNARNDSRVPEACDVATPVEASSRVQGSAVSSSHAEILSVISFWQDAGPALWFAKDVAFDARFRERFLTLHEAAARGELDPWRATADGALALIILLDQFPRNAFRGTPRMYATDERARALADEAVEKGYDRAVDPKLRMFVYLPFGHSERLEDQERSVQLCRQLGPVDVQHAEHHRDIVKRFGRFPHRNAILGRASTPDEQHYLANDGYAG